MTGALLLAANFGEAAEEGEKEEDDAEVLKLQEKANTLKKFVGLMEEGAARRGGGY